MCPSPSHAYCPEAIDVPLPETVPFPERACRSRPCRRRATEISPGSGDRFSEDRQGEGVKSCDAVSGLSRSAQPTLRRWGLPDGLCDYPTGKSPESLSSPLRKKSSWPPASSEKYKFLPKRRMVLFICRVSRFWLPCVDRDPCFPRVKSTLDSAREALRHDCPRSSSCAGTRRLE